jgi:hypothetical protein
MKLHRTLVLAPSLPFPSFSGFDLRVWQIVRALSALGPVGVFGICSNDPRAADPPPEVAVWRTSADPALAYPPPSDQKVAARAWLFDPLGHPWDLLHSEVAAGEIEALIREFRPTAFVAEGLPLHCYLPAMREHDFQLVLNCHNVETLVAREIAGSGFGSGLSAKLTRDVLPPRVAEIEKRATRNVDQLWVCSEAEFRQGNAFQTISSRFLTRSHVRLYTAGQVCKQASSGTRGGTRKQSMDAIEGSRRFSPLARRMNQE